MGGSQIGMPDKDRRQGHKRRIAEPLAIADLVCVKTPEVLLYGMPQSVMIWVIRLDKHAALQRSAACAAGNLSDKLKRTLCRAEIRKPQTCIDGNNADERYVVKIVALREHLRSHKHIYLAAIECSERLRHQSAFRHRIAVYAGDPQQRKSLLEHCFKLFGALADKIKEFALAERTYLWDAYAVAAIVADKLGPVFVVRQRNVAILAAKAFAAGPAKYKLGKAAAV